MLSLFQQTDAGIPSESGNLRVGRHTFSVKVNIDESGVHPMKTPATNMVRKDFAATKVVPASILESIEPTVRLPE